ncbi:hypothetical protein GCM10010393_15370 [Streptomyces gobitricini]|uniref:Uncharacterized protein n=1 Tax=Streptomyces gobitricini TaxID=68211 RepID=A0ABP5YUL4_9ACTN
MRQGTSVLMVLACAYPWAGSSVAQPPVQAGQAVLPSQADVPVGRPAPVATALDRAAATGEASAGHCSADGLPAVAASSAGKAQAVAACLEAGGAPAATGTEPGRRLRMLADVLRVHGLDCLLSAIGSGVCRATSVTAENVSLTYQDKGARMCITAPEVTMRGSVRLGARVLRGRVFGQVPVSMSTRTPLPVVVPYAQLTHVQGEDVVLEADQVDAPDLVIAAGAACKER